MICCFNLLNLLRRCSWCQTWIYCREWYGHSYSNSFWSILHQIRIMYHQRLLSMATWLWLSYPTTFCFTTGTGEFTAKWYKKVRYSFCSRLLHHKYVYRWIHKQHHEWTAPIAACTVYSHPLEQFLTGVLAPSTGCALTNMPLSVLCVW